MPLREKLRAHIVVIEDSDADIYLLKHALQENGIEFEMTTFDNGEEGLAALCGSGKPAIDLPAPDLILVDLNVPRSDGFEVIRKIRATPRLNDVPVAVLTSYASPAAQKKCEALGAAAWIRKETQLHALVATVGAAVRNLLEQRAPPIRRGAGGA
jgi:CheY-like chemotaxis protein